MFGYYDGTVIRVNVSLKMNQKVIVIPIEDENSIGESAAGGLHRCANSSLLEQEKDVWRKAAINKHKKMIGNN